MILKSLDFLNNEIVQTNQAIRSAGYHDVIYFRPPYGKKLFLLTWNIEPEAIAYVRVGAQNIANHIAEKVKPGSIILLQVMYDSREESRKALPIIIENLKHKGYKFVTVNELIRRGSVEGV